MKSFKGLGIALVTPFNEDKSVDFKGLENLVNHCIDNNVDYLVVQGTTGESATLTKTEKKAVLDFVVKINKQRLPVVLGVGSNNTAEVVTALQTLDLTNVDGILSVCPYYNKPSQEGIYQHFKAVLSATDLPVILYNVPGRTVTNMLPQTVLRIARDFKNAVAVKEASGNLEQVMTLVHNKPEGFLVLSGDDALTLPHIACGGDGVISVVGNSFPKKFSNLVHTALQGDFDTARKEHYDLFETIQNLFADGNPAGVKHVLQDLNICKDYVRLPLVNVNTTIANKLTELTKRI